MITTQSIPKPKIQLQYEMSNFDLTIDEGMSEALKERPGEVFGNHYAWDFCGNVFYFNNKFYESVFVHHQLIEIFEADSLEQLMTDVNKQYGTN